MHLRALALLLAACIHLPACAANPDAVEPQPRQRDYPWMSLETWKSRHAEDVAIAQAGDVDLLFLGDSITEGWDQQPIWKERIAPLRAANFGIGGDTTRNVLWRLDHGAIGHLQPRVVVLLIGTNNFGLDDDSPADVVRGITAIVERLEASFATARILVLGIFPRDASPDTQIRRQIERVNTNLRTLDDGTRVFVRDIGSVFLESDASISTEIMPDLLHLSAEGYRRWALALLPMMVPWLD